MTFCIYQRARHNGFPAFQADDNTKVLRESITNAPTLIAKKI
jgi:hypothetical protein